MTPNDHYSGRTAPLTSKICILYINSINICTDNFKHGLYCPFFHIHNSVFFILLTYLVPVLFTFYIQCVLKLKKIPAPKGQKNQNAYSVTSGGTCKQDHVLQEGRISESNFKSDFVIGTLEKRDTILKFCNSVFGKHAVWDGLFNIYFFLGGVSSGSTSLLLTFTL